MEIKCKFENRKFNDVTIYCCFVDSASIIEGNTQVSSFNGKHLHNMSDKDVEGLVFKNTNVTRFPRGLNKIFPGLKYLEITGSTLRDVSQEDLRGLDTIVYLKLDLDFSCWGFSCPTNQDNIFLHVHGLKAVSLSYYWNMNLSILLSSKLQQLTLIDIRGNANYDKFGRIMGAVVTNIIKPVIDNQNEIFQETFSEGFKKLWLSGSLSDFIIEVQEKEFKVHKIVLASRSSVFTAMFENNMIENQTMRMTIKDFSAETVEEFLSFLYTGTSPNEINSMDIFALASKYEVQQLRQICEQHILENIDETNALQVLNLGNLYCSQEMMKTAINEIVKSCPDYNIPDDFLAKPKVVGKFVELRTLHDEEIKNTGEKYNGLIQKLLSPEDDDDTTGPEAKKCKTSDEVADS